MVVLMNTNDEVLLGYW